MTSRWGMFGKDVMEDYEPTRFYHLENRLNNFTVRKVVNSEYGYPALLYSKYPMEPEFFRFMYEQVGRDYKWWYFLQKTKKELQEYLDNKESYTLMYGASPMGFALTEVIGPMEINLSYFGLTKYGIDLKITNMGSAFLGSIISNLRQDARFEGKNPRFWLYTTNRDHPAAIPAYQKVGFQITKRKTNREWIPNRLLEE